MTVTAYVATGRVPGPFRDVETLPYESRSAAAAEGHRRRFGGLKVVTRQVHPHDTVEFQEALHEALMGIGRVSREALQVETAARRMRDWAEAHGEADTQGLTSDEWIGLAAAALGVDVEPPERVS